MYNLTELNYEQSLRALPLIIPLYLLRNLFASKGVFYRFLRTVYSQSESSSVKTLFNFKRTNAKGCIKCIHLYVESRNHEEKIILKGSSCCLSVCCMPVVPMFFVLRFSLTKTKNDRSKKDAHELLQSISISFHVCGGLQCVDSS